MAVPRRRRVDEVLDLGVRRARADHHQLARAVAGTDRDVRRPRGRVQEVSRAHPALLALDDRDALAREDEEALLLALPVVVARRIARPQDVDAPAERLRRRLPRLPRGPGAAAFDPGPDDVPEVRDE